jgi:hypothetical protein
MLKALPLIAALAGAAPAYAQPAPPAAKPDAARPDAPHGVAGCPMMNGQRMMSGRAMGAHMQGGHMVDKDGKPIMGGMMGAKGMPCVPAVASVNPPPGKAAPKADK